MVAIRGRGHCSAMKLGRPAVLNRQMWLTVAALQTISDARFRSSQGKSVLSPLHVPREFHCACGPLRSSIRAHTRSPDNPMAFRPGRRTVLSLRAPSPAGRRITPRKYPSCCRTLTNPVVVGCPRQPCCRLRSMSAVASSVGASTSESGSAERWKHNALVP